MGFFLALTFFLGTSAPLQAAGNSVLSVSATVISNNNCKFQAGTATTLPFGNIDPSSAIPATASASLIIRCGGSSPTATYSLTHDSGLHETAPGANRLKHTTLTEYMPYTFTLTPSSGTIPKNTNQTITVGGSILPADFQNASVGNYSDSVVVTLNP